MSDQWDQLDDRIREILDGHGGEGVVAVRPSLVRALRGNGNAAILASELLFWSRRLGDPQGWFFQQQRRLKHQTGLGFDAQRNAVQLLVRLGVLEIARRGVPSKLYYRLNLPRLAALLCQHDKGASVTRHGPKLDAEHTLEQEPGHGPQPVAGDGPPPAAGNGRHHKEINSDNREESKGNIPPSPPKGAGTPPKKRARQSTPKYPIPVDFTIAPEMRA
jgi:hypothetical protein